MAMKYVFLPHKHTGVCAHVCVCERERERERERESWQTKLFSDFIESHDTDSDICSHSNHHSTVTQYYHY